MLFGLDRRGRIVKDYLDMYSLPAQQHNRGLWCTVLQVSDMTGIVASAP